MHTGISLDPSSVNKSVSGEALEVESPPMESQNKSVIPSQNVTPEQDHQTADLSPQQDQTVVSLSSEQDQSPSLVEQETQEPSGK